MNRLVLVGNGFDLAHGLKTTYEDFLVDYFNGIYCSNEDYEDELIKVKVSPYLNNVTLNGFTCLDDILKSPLIRQDISSGIFSSEVKYLFRYKSKFFTQLLINRNWTDIESSYIKSMLSEYKKANDYHDIDAVKRLNAEFNFLKFKLGEYLMKVNDKAVSPRKNSEILSVLKNCFAKVKSSAHQSKLVLGTLSHKYPERVVFVNFNYTSILKKYIDLLPGENREFSTYLPIHGSIEDVASIIFGYGDETHEEYKFLENQDEEELLKNIKSFYYPAKAYYQELMDFINSEDFDVYVIGHSLGLSDRVLLKTIFENEKCKAIKLYHRGSEQSQFKKRIALSRHFDDKIAMRNKILNYSDDDVFGSQKN